MQRQSARRRFSSPTGLAESSGDLWVTNFGGPSVTEINSSTGAFVQVIKGSKYQFLGPEFIAADSAHIWVPNGERESVSEITT